MDFRYLVEMKNEFNNFLCGILTPHLYHGIKGMLKYSENVYNQIELKNKKGSKISNPGIIIIFKKTLDGISNLNNHEIESEYLRIKNTSGCIEWFDKMIRAAFKSYVLFLTWDPKISNSKYSDNTIYDTIEIKDFIHKCYIISCNYFKNNPELFINKNSKKEIFDILKMCIEMSIKKSLPYNDIINEYLNVEFNKIDNNINIKEIENIKTMVFNMMNKKKYGIRPDIKNLIEEDTFEDDYINLEDPEYKKIQLEKFINQENIKQQYDLHDIENNNQINNIEHSLQKLNNVEQSLQKSNNDSTLLLTRTNMKNKEIENYMNKISDNNINERNNIISETTNNNKISETSNIIFSETNNNKISETTNNNKFSKTTNNNKISETSNNNKISETNNNKNSEINNNKNSEKTNNIISETSIDNIISFPPVIKQKKENLLNELFGLNKSKKNIKITRSKNNIMSEKFDNVESYYQDMINS
jgi:hypothetical protein